MCREVKKLVNRLPEGHEKKVQKILAAEKWSQYFMLLEGGRVATYKAIENNLVDQDGNVLKKGAGGNNKSNGAGNNAAAGNKNVSMNAGMNNNSRAASNVASGGLFTNNSATSGAGGSVFNNNRGRSAGAQQSLVSAGGPQQGRNNMQRSGSMNENTTKAGRGRRGGVAQREREAARQAAQAAKGGRPQQGNSRNASASGGKNQQGRLGARDITYSDLNATGGQYTPVGDFGTGDGVSDAGATPMLISGGGDDLANPFAADNPYNMTPTGAMEDPMAMVGALTPTGAGVVLTGGETPPHGDVGGATDVEADSVENENLMDLCDAFRDCLYSADNDLFLKNFDRIRRCRNAMLDCDDSAAVAAYLKKVVMKKSATATSTTQRGNVQNGKGQGATTQRAGNMNQQGHGMNKGDLSRQASGVAVDISEADVSDREQLVLRDFLVKLRRAPGRKLSMQDLGAGLWTQLKKGYPTKLREFFEKYPEHFEVEPLAQGAASISLLSADHEVQEVTNKTSMIYNMYRGRYPRVFEQAVAVDRRLGLVPGGDKGGNKGMGKGAGAAGPGAPVGNTPFLGGGGGSHRGMDSFGTGGNRLFGGGPGSRGGGAAPIGEPNLKRQRMA
eukprot:g10045.t1